MFVCVDLCRILKIQDDITVILAVLCVSCFLCMFGINFFLGKETRVSSKQLSLVEDVYVFIKHVIKLLLTQTNLTPQTFCCTT